MLRDIQSGISLSNVQRSVPDIADTTGTGDYFIGVPGRGQAASPTLSKRHSGRKPEPRVSNRHLVQVVEAGYIQLAS